MAKKTEHATRTQKRKVLDDWVRRLPLLKRWTGPPFGESGVRAVGPILVGFRHNWYEDDTYYTEAWWRSLLPGENRQEAMTLIASPTRYVRWKLHGEYLNENFAELERARILGFREKELRMRDVWMAHEQGLSQAHWSRSWFRKTPRWASTAPVLCDLAFYWIWLDRTRQARAILKRVTRPPDGTDPCPIHLPVAERLLRTNAAEAREVVREELSSLNLQPNGELVLR